MKRYIRNTENKFSTFEISNFKGLQYICGSHIYIAQKSERELLADDIFQFIDSAYDGIGGFKSFKDMDRFINDSYLWYITYDGPQPSNLEHFDIRKVYVVSIFRQNHGLKMVGMARRKILPDENNRHENMIMRQNANSALHEHIRFTTKVGWAEVSGQLEKHFNNTLTIHDVIDPYILKEEKVFKNMEIDMDEFHYYRPLRTGEQPVCKIAYGNIKI